jgi:UDP-N-acetylglucosamine--N-acetylmuramyl-(pentapeptide) pyrophosphoryl-undecaprenol N-acetylglucosamine transferase
MRVILAGGGTGGHVIPALAIARELQSRYSAECCFIGTQRGIETRLVPAAGFPLHLIKVGALNRVSLSTRMKTMLGLPAAVWSSLRILRDFRPDAMIGVGGYASGPAMLASVLRRVPSVAFEPNLVPGFANRMVAPFVSAAAVHFEDTKQYFGNCRVTGVPVRAEFFQLPPRDPASPPTLLVFGGSQGAHAINQALCGSIASLRQRIPEIQLRHQTGERDFDETVTGYEKLGMPVATSKLEVSKFMDNMPAMFARADLVVCRAGASTVAEIAAAGRPAVFIPFPRAADDHQRRNAEAMQKAGAAVMIEERDLTPARLVDTVVELLSDATKLKAMSSAARGMAHPNAARDIAELAASLIDPSSKLEAGN